MKASVPTFHAGLPYCKLDAQMKGALGEACNGLALPAIGFALGFAANTHQPEDGSQTTGDAKLHFRACPEDKTQSSGCSSSMHLQACR